MHEICYLAADGDGGSAGCRGEGVHVEYQIAGITAAGGLGGNATAGDVQVRGDQREITAATTGGANIINVGRENRVGQRDRGGAGDGNGPACAIAQGFGRNISLAERDGTRHRGGSVAGPLDDDTASVAVRAAGGRVLAGAAAGNEIAGRQPRGGEGMDVQGNVAGIAVAGGLGGQLAVDQGQAGGGECEIGDTAAGVPLIIDVSGEDSVGQADGGGAGDGNGAAFLRT